MFQGTGSGVGKSIVAAAMCRILARKGVSVAPFKAQNMALNSFVTADGKEMGRAQVFQAQACGLIPDVRMNPVLLKPSSDSRSQVIVMGSPCEHLGARDYYRRSQEHWHAVRQAYDSLSSQFDVMVIEGAGSPAEINLRNTDIVNMRMADYAGAAVVLVADIDRGGVFASLKGTYDLVGDRYRHLIKAFLINKFRGDVSLLEPGIKMFYDIVPVPVLGVLPWFRNIHVDEEDGVFVEKIESKGKNGSADLKVVIARVPRISNFTDFFPVGLEPDVELVLSDDPDTLFEADVLIIPGTKATTSDLEFLKGLGWEKRILDFVNNGGVVAGICGGFQMLGISIWDDIGSDGRPGKYNGFGLLPLETEMVMEKALRQISIVVDCPSLSNGPMLIDGYEIHMGRSRLQRHSKDICSIASGDSEIFIFHKKLGILGTYIHGIFDNDRFRRAFLNLARKRKGLAPMPVSINYARYQLDQFDRLADWLESNSNIDELLKLVDV